MANKCTMYSVYTCMNPACIHNIMHAYNQEYVIGKEGEYPTSLWYCVTTLYQVHNLCNNIYKQSGFTVHHIPAVVTGVVLYMPYRLASMPTNNKL